MGRRTGSTALSLCTLELMEFVAGEHGKRRHLAVASRAASVPEFAVGVAVVALVISDLPSKLPVAHMRRFGGSRSDSRGGSVRGRAAGGLARGSLLIVGVSTALLGVGVDANVTGEFVATAETFFATGMCADVGLFAGVGANVTGLVFETIKGTRAERTLVRTRDLRFVDGVVAGSKRSRLWTWIGHVGGSRLSHCVRARFGDAGALKDGNRFR